MSFILSVAVAIKGRNPCARALSARFSSSLQELLALRKLQRSQARQGIDVVKLNRGELKKHKAKAEDTPEGISETQKFGLQPGKAEPEDEEWVIH